MQDSKLKDKIKEILLSEGFTEIIEFIHPETIDNLLNLKLSNETMMKGIFSKKNMVHTISYVIFVRKFVL